MGMMDEPSSTNSMDSVDFLEEIPPLPPISYFRIQESDTFESLLRHLSYLFPRGPLRSALIILIQMKSGMELLANFPVPVFRYLFRIPPTLI